MGDSLLTFRHLDNRGARLAFKARRPPSAHGRYLLGGGSLSGILAHPSAVV
ncbi:hypothetical protein BOS5A_210581 [Bosea sp. EC-HK365B]|nr:hypothetical protein BOSE7B_120443 [Bosea sp. 7B]CAD5277243.1 hypothetical protein BOSE21B_30470 [Bosea sp. 21B]VVT59790.1 hypothetical protein BOS5A_210581 [Bosea sp. EC-HK365B]VXC05193.1 hypothetical protein BOSE127_170082 [Bosea sp. 127]